MGNKNIILLENIRSILNVGSVFRIADGVGAEIALVGYTPAPIDRFKRKNKKLSKTALGAEETVIWKQFNTTEDAIKAYEKTHEIVAVEQTETSVEYTDYKYIKPTLFIFGNEVGGVDKATLDQIKKHIEIPMENKKESLNISTAVGIVLYNAKIK